MFPLVAYSIFYFFAGLVILQGISSLRGGFRFLNYIKEQLALPRSKFTPQVSIIAPCRGLDQGLRENLAALFRQDFPKYEIVFVTDDAQDPSLAVIESLCEEFSGKTSVTVQTIVAGEAENRGQKVHNLLAAIEKIDPGTEVLAFVDSDARPSVNWLRSLVAPLADEAVGAATGYRWFIPERGGLFSHLRSLWNASIASALGANREKNFCWGGATAIRRARFEELKIVEHWQGALSDDFAMTRALQAAKSPIHFVPQCLTVSREDCGLLDMLEFTTRQMKITRVYARHLWLTVMIGSCFFCIVFFTNLVTSVSNAIWGGPFVISAIMVTIMFALGAGKSLVRLRAVALALPEWRDMVWRGAWVHLCLWPVTSALYIYNCDEARRSRLITWRGITYELKSPRKTVIIRQR